MYSCWVPFVDFDQTEAHITVDLLKKLIHDVTLFLVIGEGIVSINYGFLIEVACLLIPLIFVVIVALLFEIFYAF